MTVLLHNVTSHTLTNLQIVIVEMLHSENGVLHCATIPYYSIVNAMPRLAHAGTGEDSHIGACAYMRGLGGLAYRRMRFYAGLEKTRI